MEIKINKKTLIDAINNVDKTELNKEIEEQIKGDDGMYEKFCEGEVEFEVVYGLDRISGYVKIPKQECTSSDDDFEIWIYTENGVIEDCDYHGWINPYIHDFIWGNELEQYEFLEIICDKAHKKETVEEYNYTNSKGEEILEMTLITNGSTFKWDVEE